jgi:predicted metal-dependent hydrolase
MNNTSPDIVVRRLPFEFPDDIQPHWIPGNPEFAHMANGASVVMPYLEPFLIRSLRDGLAQVKDPQLLADGASFIGQEGQHFRAHRRFNDLLKAKGYEELAEVEALMERRYAQLGRRSLRTRLAYTAGFESMTLGMTKWLINDRVALFANADPRVASLILWHMVEETEHKCVAFDVYQAVCGAYLPRAFGVFHGTLDVMRFSMHAYRAMLRKDGLWYQWRSRLRLARQLLRFLRHAIPYLLRATLPGHSPRDEADPQWVKDWIAGHARSPADAPAPLLDTRHPQIPVPFPTTATTA